MLREELYKKLLEKHKEKQVIIAIEELSELQKELCKSLRNKTNFHNILEEIADVEIMVEQMKIYFDVHEEDVEAMKEYKLERTQKRLGL